MLWIRRIVVSLPLAIAGVLNVLIVFADRLHLRLERIAGYGFLFATPWAWVLALLDGSRSRWVHSRWVESLIQYAVVLWIPALLYSVVLWLLIRALGWRRRVSVGEKSPSRKFAELHHVRCKIETYAKPCFRQLSRWPPVLAN